MEGKKEKEGSRSKRSHSPSSRKFPIEAAQVTSLAQPRFARPPQPVRAGDAVGVRLDFDSDLATWYVNGVEVYTLRGLPQGEVFAAVALDQPYDEVRIRDARRCEIREVYEIS